MCYFPVANLAQMVLYLSHFFIFMVVFLSSNQKIVKIVYISIKKNVCVLETEKLIQA